MNNPNADENLVKLTSKRAIQDILIASGRPVLYRDTVVTQRGIEFTATSKTVNKAIAKLVVFGFTFWSSSPVLDNPKLVRVIMEPGNPLVMMQNILNHIEGREPYGR